MNAPAVDTSHEGGFGSVESLIPHRRPFLLIDSVEQAHPGEYAISQFVVDPALPLFVGHFPDQPVFPGVLVVENMAQTACWVMAAGAAKAWAAARSDAQPGALEADSQALATDALKTEYRLARIVQCTFSAPVMPGDSIRTEARLTRSVPPFSQFQCSSFVGARKVADAQLLVAGKVIPAQRSGAVNDTPASPLS